MPFSPRRKTWDEKKPDAISFGRWTPGHNEFWSHLLPDALYPSTLGVLTNRNYKRKRTKTPFVAACCWKGQATATSLCAVLCCHRDTILPSFTTLRPRYPQSAPSAAEWPILLNAARNVFEQNILDSREPKWARLVTRDLADTLPPGFLRISLERLPMPAYARSRIVPPDEVGVYHCMARCVRRALLAVSIPSPSTTTTIARNGSANDSSCLHRVSRSISALPIQLDKYLSL